MALSKLVCLLYIAAQLVGVLGAVDQFTLDDCKEIAWDCSLACRNYTCPGEHVWTLGEDGVCILIENECFYNSRYCNSLLIGEKPLKRVTQEECMPKCPRCNSVTPAMLCATNGRRFDIFSGKCRIAEYSCQTGEFWRETDMDECHNFFENGKVSSQDLV